MATTTATRAEPVLWTYDDLDLIPQQRAGDRHELFDGELVVTASPIPDHQIIVGNAYAAIRGVVRPSRLGQVFLAPTDVKFAPEVVMVPDMVFVRQARLGILRGKAIEGTPDFVMEVLSPGTRTRDVGRKKGIYGRFGVEEYWVVDPKLRELDAFVFRDGVYQPLPEEDGVVRSLIVPGLALDAETLFADT